MIDDVHVIVRIYEKSRRPFNSTTYESMYLYSTDIFTTTVHPIYESKIITSCYSPIDAAFDTFHHSFTVYLPFFFLLFRNSKTGLTSKLLFK